MDDNWDGSPTTTSSEDAELWGDLATMWNARDPMPNGLVERVLVAIATEDLDAEYELLHLVERSHELAGARGSTDAVTISFAGDSFSLLLRVSGTDSDVRRVDGWVTPAQEMHVSVKQGGRTFEADVDAGGRFEIPRLPSGPSRVWLVGRTEAQRAEGQELFATPTFDL